MISNDSHEPIRFVYTAVDGFDEPRYPVKLYHKSFWLVSEQHVPTPIKHCLVCAFDEKTALACIVSTKEMPNSDGLIATQLVVPRDLDLLAKGGIESTHFVNGRATAAPCCAGLPLDLFGFIVDESKKQTRGPFVVRPAPTACPFELG